MVITVQNYIKIRQRFLAGESKRHITKTLGLSRNTVAKYCDGSAVPWERKTPKWESPVIKDDVTAFIRLYLQEDEAPRFQKAKIPQNGSTIIL